MVYIAIITTSLWGSREDSAQRLSLVHRIYPYLIDFVGRFFKKKTKKPVISCYNRCDTIIIRPEIGKLGAWANIPELLQ